MVHLLAPLFRTIFSTYCGRSLKKKKKDDIYSCSEKYLSGRLCRDEVDRRVDMERTSTELDLTIDIIHLDRCQSKMGTP